MIEILSAYRSEESRGAKPSTVNYVSGCARNCPIALASVDVILTNNSELLLTIFAVVLQRGKASSTH